MFKPVKKLLIRIFFPSELFYDGNCIVDGFQTNLDLVYRNRPRLERTKGSISHSGIGRIDGDAVKREINFERLWEVSLSFAGTSSMPNIVCFECMVLCVDEDENVKLSPPLGRKNGTLVQLFDIYTFPEAIVMIYRIACESVTMDHHFCIRSPKPPTIAFSVDFTCGESALAPSRNIPAASIPLSQTHPLQRQDRFASITLPTSSLELTSTRRLIF
jgi:hypothetical protein